MLYDILERLDKNNTQNEPKLDRGCQSFLQGQLPPFDDFDQNAYLQILSVDPSDKVQRDKVQVSFFWMFKIPKYPKIGLKCCD